MKAWKFSLSDLKSVGCVDFDTPCRQTTQLKLILDCTWFKNMKTCFQEIYKIIIT